LAVRWWFAGMSAELLLLLLAVVSFSMDEEGAIVALGPVAVVVVDVDRDELERMLSLKARANLPLKRATRAGILNIYSSYSLGTSSSNQE